MSINWGAALAEVANQSDYRWMRFVLDHRDEIFALDGLELRDRWGTHLGVEKLARIVEYLVQNPDQQEDELIDSLAIEMLTGEVPMVCSDYDTPAEDELLREIVRAVRKEA